MAFLPTALTIASTIFSFYSQYQSGKQNDAVAKANARIEEENAKINAAAARDTLQRGADEAAERKDYARKIAAKQRAGAAAGGVMADTGSPLDLLVETAGMGEMDALTTLNNAQRQAYGYEVQALNNRTQASSLRSQGKQAKSQAIGNSFGTLLTGGSKAYGQGKDAGLWG